MKPHTFQVTSRQVARNPFLGLGEELADAQKVFVENLNRWLAQLDLSDAEFARRVGVSQPTAFNWRTAKIYPSLKTLGRIAEALGIHLWQLLHDPKEETPAPKLRLDPAEEALRAMAEQLGKKIRFERLKVKDT